MADQKLIPGPGHTWVDATPQPGNTYTRDTWPPRGRGRGEALSSPRRVAAKLRAFEALHLRNKGYGWATIASLLGYKCPSGAWRACDRIHQRNRANEERKGALQLQRIQEPHTCQYPLCWQAGKPCYNCLRDKDE